MAGARAGAGAAEAARIASDAHTRADLIPRTISGRRLRGSPDNWLTGERDSSALRILHHRFAAGADSMSAACNNYDGGLIPHDMRRVRDVSQLPDGDDVNVERHAIRDAHR